MHNAYVVLQLADVSVSESISLLGAATFRAAKTAQIGAFVYRRRMPEADESQQIEAQGRADVARLQAWQAVVVDVLALAAITVVAVLRVMPSEVIVALFTTIVAGRMVMARPGSPGGGGAVMALLGAAKGLLASKGHLS